MNAIRTVAYHDNPWGVVVSLARASLSIRKALCELLDNAFDAGAKNVRVDCAYYNGRAAPDRYNGSRLVVEDDGRGIPNLDALVGMGEHIAHDGAGSGIYGVGFKHAVLRLGGEDSVVNVTTNRGGEGMFATIDWSALRRTEPCMTIRTARAAKGTCIDIRPLRTRLIDDRTAFAEFIRYTYHPLLSRGVRMEFCESNTIHCDDPTIIDRGFKTPILKEAVEDTIAFPGGRKAHIRAGIVDDGATTPYAGITYVYGYRVVKSASRAGCGAKYAVGRFFGVVTLEGPWQRTTNKDDLVDADDLYDAVYTRVEDLLRRADSEAHTLQINRGLESLSSDISKFLSSFRGGRSKLGRSIGGGRKKSGESGTGRRGRSPVITIKPIYGWVKGAPIGRFDGTGVLDLYADHPLLDERRACMSRAYDQTSAVFDRRAWFIAAVSTLALHAGTLREAEIDMAFMLSLVDGGALLDGAAPIVNSQKEGS